MHRRLPALGRLYRRMADRRWQSRTVTMHNLTLCLPPPMVDVDLQERSAILNEAQKADVFIDVGANVGLYSFLVAASGKPVVAVEPLKQNLDVLARNVQLNPSLRSLIEIAPIGLSDREGQVTIYGFGTVASLISTWNATANSHQETISVSTLDKLIGDRFVGAKLLIKIDVEGCELRVLQGAKTVLARTPRPAWLVEIFRNFPTTGATNPDFDATFSIFDSYGYSVTAIDEKNFLFQAPQTLKVN